MAPTTPTSRSSKLSRVVNNLNQRGVPVEYILFPDEGHGFRKIPNRIRSTVEITRWFVKYLKEPEQTANN
jgi:dipeptidyl aminopeptidase/acylaminoacyl peptidase